MFREFTPETFAAEVIETKPLALIGFTASWCAPSQTQLPILQRVAEVYAGKALVAAVDVDHCEPLADQWQIRTLPTLLLIAEGQLVEALIGFQQEEFLRAYLDHLLQQAG